MKDWRTIYWDKQTVMGLEDTKRISENYHRMLAKPAALTRVKSWRYPFLLPRVHGWRKTYSSGRDCKENAAPRCMLALMLPRVELLFYPELGRWEKQEEGSKKRGELSGPLEHHPPSKQYYFHLPYKHALFADARRPGFQLSDVLPHRGNNKQKKEAQTLHSVLWSTVLRRVFSIISSSLNMQLHHWKAPTDKENSVCDRRE